MVLLVFPTLWCVEAYSTVFIANMSWNVTEHELAAFASNMGELIGVEISRSNTNMQSKGRGWIYFKTREAASAAVEQMNGMNFFGRKIVARLDRSQSGATLSKSNSVYVGNLTYHVTAEMLFAAFAKCQPVSARIHLTPSGLSNGSGSVLFSSHALAETAIREMNRFPLMGRPIQV